MAGDVALAGQGGNDWIGQLTAQFLSTRKSVNTRDAYRRDLSSWLRWCAAAGVHPVEDARYGDVLAWVASLAPDPAAGRAGEAGTTRNRRLSAVASWYRWLIRHGATERNPAAVDPAERPTAAPRPTPALSPAQAEQLLAAADRDGPRSALVVYLMVYTGIRVGELIAADDGDVGMTDGEMILHVRAKGGKTRQVRLNQYVMRRYQAWQEARPDRDTPLPVVAGQAGAGSGRPLVVNGRGSRLYRNEVQRLLRRLARGAGIPPEMATRLSPHVTRATYATSSFAGNLTLRAVQQTMGHASPLTTIRYDRSGLTAAQDPAVRLLEFIHPPTGHGE